MNHDLTLLSGADAVPAEDALHPYMDPRRQVTKALPGLELVHKRRLLSEEGRKLTEWEAHLRRAQAREFKDEFVPKLCFEGYKEGYYFTSGDRGLGYYLDAEWCDYNDPDDQGYVLVRTAPAVALHRALPKRNGTDKGGLLFSESFLESMGPVHGKPNHRYKLISPPWLCEMRAPVEGFEKKHELTGQTVRGKNELLCERLSWLQRRVGEVEAVMQARGEKQQVVRVASKMGAVVRSGVELTSPVLSTLTFGSRCVVAGTATSSCGRQRLKLDDGGWISTKSVDKKQKKKKQVTAAQKQQPEGKCRGAAASNSGLMAECPLDCDKEAETTVVAQPEEEQAVVVVVVESPSGPLTLRGDELMPVIPADCGRAEWKVVLELGGHDGRRRPLAFKATLKPKFVLSPVSRLLETFAKQHRKKYPNDDALLAADFRLHSVSEDRHVEEATLIAELIKDWSGDVAAKFTLTRRRGSGADSTVTQTPRAKELALRLSEQPKEITKWSSHLDVLRERGRDGLSAEPKTSEEIQAYWADASKEKHWRTTAALRGFATRTEDTEKLEAWSKNLEPKPGFLNDPDRKPAYPDR